MNARIDNPAFAVPGAMDALQALGKAVGDTGLPPVLLTLLLTRASQINGCSVCLYGHSRSLRELGESDERIFGVAAWREMPFYTAAERAALALCEAETRIADRPEGVSDDVWKDAAAHFSDAELAGLVLCIANINLWTRLNVTTRQVAGATW